MTLFYFNRFFRALPFVSLMLLVSCSYVPDQLNPIDWADRANEWVKGGIWADKSSEPDPEARVGEGHGRLQPGEEDPFPSLAMVPDERPSISSPEVREILAEQLIADRENAQYSPEPEAGSKPVGAISERREIPSISRPVTRQSPGAERARSEVVSRSPAPPSASTSNPPSASSRRQDRVSDEFAIEPPPAPSVPDWRSVEQQFYSLFQASGGGVAGDAIPAADYHVDGRQNSAINSLAPATGSVPNIDTGGPYSSIHAAVIYFGHGSASLSRQDREVLRQVAAVQKDYGGTVRVVGHASSKTKTSDLLDHKIANHETSLARARAVAEALVKLGVPVQNVFVEALSDAQPEYSEATSLGEAANRRANVFIDFLSPPG